jgi:predicted RNA-binding protein YlqC (UPF0109 family)
MMVELVTTIAKALVDCPDMVEVKETTSNQGVLIEVKVAPEDMGKIIGKQGRIAKALRAVVKAAATRTGQKVAVEIMQ